MKTCYICKTEKAYSEFNKNAQRKDGYNPSCKDCCKEYRIKNRESILQKKKNYYEAHKDYYKEYKQQYYLRNKETLQTQARDYYSQVDNRKKRLLAKAKERASIEKMDFNLELNDITIPEYCPYLDIKLTHVLGKGQLISNSSIDRIDSSKGYIKGNVQIISRLANTMKSNATPEQLVTFAANVFKIHKQVEGTTCKKYTQSILESLA